MTIGERIKEIREMRGMTQEELALACGYKSRKCFLSFSHYFYNLTGKQQCGVAILLQIKKGDGQEHGKKKGGKQKPMNLPPPT